MISFDWAYIDSLETSNLWYLEILTNKKLKDKLQSSVLAENLHEENDTSRILQVIKETDMEMIETKNDFLDRIDKLKHMLNGLIKIDK